MGAIETTCQALAEDMGARCQVVAVCGRNKKLIQRLQARFGPLPTPPPPQNKSKRTRTRYLPPPFPPGEGRPCSPEQYR